MRYVVTFRGTWRQHETDHIRVQEYGLAGKHAGGGSGVFDELMTAAPKRLTQSDSIAALGGAPLLSIMPLLYAMTPRRPRHGSGAQSWHETHPTVDVGLILEIRTLSS